MQPEAAANIGIVYPARNMETTMPDPIDEKTEVRFLVDLGSTTDFASLGSPDEATAYRHIRFSIQAAKVVSPDI